MIPELTAPHVFDGCVQTPGEGNGFEKVLVLAGTKKGLFIAESDGA